MKDGSGQGAGEGTEQLTAGLTETEEKEFLAAVAVSFCPECGKEIVPNRRGRPKKFCSEACRFAWKNKHPKPENWRKESLTCPICGREFQARGYGDVKRKYCSRACANRGRAVERRDTIVPEQDNEKS